MLVCTYRDFLALRLDSDGKAQEGERLILAPNEDAFWALNGKEAEETRGSDFVEFLKRALLGDAPLSAPADLAWSLAAYARIYIGRRAIVATLGRSGVRVSELCDIRIRDLRLHAASGAHFRIPDAKTEAGIREVHVSPDLLEEIVGHIDAL